MRSREQALKIHTRLRSAAVAGALALVSGSAGYAQQVSTIVTFNQLSELKQIDGPRVALQLGDAGGIWIRKDGPKNDNSGTIVGAGDDHHWSRQCDPGWVDAVAIQLKTGRPKKPSNPKAGQPFLRMHDRKTGEQLSELRLSAAPVFDGMAASGGKLFISTKDGRLTCFEE